MGVSSFGRAMLEHAGITKRSRFSYSAKRRSRRSGTVDDCWASVGRFEVLIVSL